MSQVVFLVLGGLVALGWSLLAVRLVRLTANPWFRFLGPAKAGLRSGWDEWPKVAAIVPARNEADHVAGTVESLRRQDYPDLTLTLVDDESTDSTLAILHQLQAESIPGSAPLTVIVGLPRPGGWVGKTWAVDQGVRSTQADWLWFVDADMTLDPAALQLALMEAQRTGADLVSFLPGVACATFWQRTIASSFLHILAHLYPLHHVNDPERPEALAAGGFLLIRRSMYEKVGGHAAVRNAIVEDIALARHVKQAGGRLAVRLAPQLASTHMYGSFRDIWDGLRKNAYAGMDYQPHKLVVGAGVALTMAWVPLLTITAGWFWGSWALGLVGIAGVLAQVAATVPNLIFIRASWFYALALPAGITAYVAIALASAWNYHRGRIDWKGRSIDVATVAESVVLPQHTRKSDEIRGQVLPERR